MKRCPTCNRTFTEEHLTFCVEDGTPLVKANSVDDEATVVRSGSDDTSRESPGSAGASGAFGDRPAAYQPPGSYVPRGSYGESRRRTWPWILGALLVLAVFVGFGIAAVFVTRNIAKKYDEAERQSNPTANTNERNANSNLGSNSNSNSSNLNENSNQNSNADDSADESADDSMQPPTDQAEVLSQLTDLEHEWTMANINADKKKLERILADDYVETTPRRPRGKAEYLNTIKRDTSIQRWNFEELKVDLKSDRATLTGTIRMDITDEHGQLQPLAFVFTDKFVWRDGRWQATGSEVKAKE